MQMKSKKRRLTEADPEREARYIEHKVSPPIPSTPLRILKIAEHILDEHTHPRGLRTVTDLLGCVDRLLDADRLGRQATVVGCGPKPEIMRELEIAGYRTIGIEPVSDGLRKAVEYLAGAAEVVPGSAERMPLESGSQTLVLMENVLEHVDSVTASLAESYRVLKPGGVLFVRTTNRIRFSITGINWEFTTRFFNWFPRMVRESYIFAQLHYRPEIAYYSPRPAVHWFSFPDLCDYGREAGFARFYSPHDLLHLVWRDSMPAWRFRLSDWRRRQPWIRAIAISQMGGDIFMWKREG